jgi:hypothetical protein
MKNTMIRHVLAAVVIGAGFAVSVFAQAPAPLTREDSVKVSVTATVTAIDMAKREVTLKKPSGELITLTVDTRVQRLNEVKVGDRVTADYYVAYAAELRPPTDEEKANPLVVLQQTAKAPAGTAPAGGALRVTRAIVTVEGIDRRQSRSPSRTGRKPVRRESRRRTSPRLRWRHDRCRVCGGPGRHAGEAGGE